MSLIRVVMPAHLRTLASVNGEVAVEVAGAVTIRTVIDELEKQFPALRGAIRDHVSKERRPFVRFFACESDLSHDSVDDLLPSAVVEGREPLLVVGAIAGGAGC